MTTRTHHIIQIGLMLAALVLSLIFWNKMPDRIPIHYNLQGEIDNYGPKGMLFLLFPGIGLLVYAIIQLLPMIDPKRNIRDYMDNFRSFGTILMAFLFCLYLVQLLGILGYSHNLNQYIPMLIIFMMMALGNFFGKLRPNYFIGIRTPWTLENERVWIKTHRFAGYVWVLASIVMLIAFPFLKGNFLQGLFIAYIGVLVAAPVLYSFIIYRKLKNGTAI
ncbi:MAG: SdpI family protein [Chitinophagales bacterium]|nr:SdpI family protein [Chitinophagales bacterium]